MNTLFLIFYTNFRVARAGYVRMMAMTVNLTAFYISLPVSAVIAAFAIWKKALSPSAAAVAVLMLVSSSLFAGWIGLSIFIFSFVFVSAAELVIKKKFARGVIRGVHAKEERRDAVQVLVNGIAATLSAVLFAVTGEETFLFAFVAALAEGAADSLASEIGALSPKPPVDIIKRKRIPAGMSGGVSLIGNLAAASGAAAITAFLFIFVKPSLNFVWAFVAALAGVTLDSILGSLVQAKYRCAVCGKATEKTFHCGAPAELSGGLKCINNDAVNLAGSIFAAVLSAILVYYI